MTARKNNSKDLINLEYTPSKKEVSLDKLQVKASELALKKIVKYRKK